LADIQSVETEQSPIRRFLRKSWSEKLVSFQFRWTWLTSALTPTFPVRLPVGIWWVPRNDNLSVPLLAGSFEISEMAFVKRYLQPGMTVLDLGAHQGLYTILSAKRVGPRGKVYAFEPSSRERRILRQHVWLNFCTNVAIQPLALGNEDGECELFVVNGTQTGCNSLRPPVVFSGTTPQPVRIARLDDWLDRQQIGTVDFIKLDVEGAELDVLKGAVRLLERQPRPVILAEVQEIRTRPWNYHAIEIVRLLVAKGFRWFSLLGDGSLSEFNKDAKELDENLVAWPEEVPVPEMMSGSIVR
jgi:FkbM family methyltransferase